MSLGQAVFSMAGMLEPTLAAAAVWHAGMALRVVVGARATGGRLAICQVSGPPGSSTPVHRHEHEDEVLHVVSGEVSVWQQGSRVNVAAGASLLLPQGLPHRLTVGADGPAEFLLAFLPGGVEDAIVSASSADPMATLDPDDVAALLAPAGVSVYGWDTRESPHV